MEIRLRPIVASDEAAYLSDNYGKVPYSDELWQRVTEEFRALIRTKGIYAMAAVDENDVPAGYVVAAFLKPEFEQSLRTRKVPDIVSKLIRETSVIDSDKELGQVNARGILVGSLITFHYKDSLSLIDYAQVKNELMYCAVNYFSGFNLSEIMIEIHSQEAHDELKNAGFTVVNHYEDWWNENKGTRESCPMLMTITRADAQRGVDFHLLRMFVFERPQFRFTLGERELLRAAMSGMTDTEIAEQLSIGPDTVKGRWKSIYQRAQSIFEEDENAILSSTRSREKRRKIISFVQSRPQELRPYFPGSTRDDCG